MPTIPAGQAAADLLDCVKALPDVDTLHKDEAADQEVVERTLYFAQAGVAGVDAAAPFNPKHFASQLANHDGEAVAFVSGFLAARGWWN